ncbi:MAG: LD-carboxypeptidase [Pseudomonadota bacterium]
MSKSKRHIALVCPGGPISPDLADKLGEFTAAHCGDRAELHFHPQCFLEAGHFAGTDAERSAAFLKVANDPAFDAVWFARGGYGAIRLDDAVYGKLNDAARAKTWFGYSDNGAILARLYGMGFKNLAHGPIAVDLNREGGEAAIARALDYLVFNKQDGLEPELDGRPTVAFNITVLSNIAAAPWAPSLAGHVVLMEDVGEYLYRIDRALGGLMVSLMMKNIAGVRLGRITDIPENDRPFGADEEEIVRYWCERTGVPYLGRAGIGHDAKNKIVPFGPRPEG